METTGFEGNVEFFTTDFHKLVHPWNPVVQEVASQLNQLSYERNAEDMLGNLLVILGSIFEVDTDENLYGEEDHWASPEEMVEAGAGDCDDFAVFASSVLFALGVPHYVVMGYYQAVGGHVWIEVDEGPRVYLLEFTVSTLFILDRAGKQTYDETLYMPMERVLVS